MAHLLGGGQTVLCCAQDAADKAELLDSELGYFRPLLFLEEAADGQPSAAGCGSEEREQELVRLAEAETAHVKTMKRWEERLDMAPTNPPDNESFSD